MKENTHSQVGNSDPIVGDVQQAVSSIDPNLFGLGLMAIAWLLFHLWSNKNKGGVVGRARFATSAEIRAGKAEAVATINDPYEMTLWIGMPDQFSISPEGKIHIVPNKNTVMLRNMNEHAIFWGSSGGGKSRFFLDPIARAALMLLLRGVIIDLKGDEERKAIRAPSSHIAGFALAQGYEIFVVAPYFEDSRCMNIVRLLKDQDDITTALILSTALVTNGLALGEKPNNWDMSGAQLIAACMMVARGQPEGRGDDMATVQQILARLAADPDALSNANLTQQQKIAFSEYKASTRSPETAASVVFSALRMMGRLMASEITGVFCRGSEVPVVLGPKQLVIFRVDPKYQTVVLPIVSAIAEIMMERNIHDECEDGGFLLFDELPQYYLPSLPNKIVTARSKKWCILAAAQEENILEMRYGKDKAAAIVANCQTVGILRVTGNDTAKKFSEGFGKEDIGTKSKTNGKHTSTTDQESQRDLVPIEELKQQKKGRCILESPTISSKESGDDQRVRLPYRLNVRLPRAEKIARKVSLQNWEKYRKIATARSTAKPLTDKDFRGRELLAEHLFPASKIDVRAEVTQLFSHNPPVNF
jgi:type IV secretory pathway TraG/TraD family ATPase VirD4